MGIIKEKAIFLLILFILPKSLLFSQADESSKILEQNKAGVISLVVYGNNKEVIAKGSAFGINTEIVATSYDLISSAQSVEGVNFKGGKIKVEGILAIDKTLDLALLKIKGKVQILVLGNSDALEMGKRVFIMGGNDAGEIKLLQGTLKNFYKLSPAHRVVDSSPSPPETFTGGPLFDSNSQVLALNISLGEKLKFAVPINMLKNITKQTKEIDFNNWQHEDYLSTVDGALLAGRLSVMMNDNNSGQKYLEKAVQLNPAIIDAQCILASIYDEQKNYSSAIAAYEKALESDPRRSEAYFGLGLVYLKMLRYNDAISPLEKAIQLNLDYKVAYYYIGNAYEELKDIAKAADAYEKYLNLRPENPVSGYVRLASSQMQLNQFEKAIATFQEALNRQPRDVKTNLGLAQAYQKAGQYDKAEEIYKYLAELNPNNALSYYSYIVKMYDESANTEKAILAAKKVIELDPRSEMAIYNLGIMFFKLERFDEAIETFKQVLTIRPDYSYAYFQIGLSYNKLKKTKESIEAFKKFVELSPDNADGWFSIGIDYMTLKDFKAALEPLKKMCCD